MKKYNVFRETIKYNQILTIFKLRLFTLIWRISTTSDNDFLTTLPYT